MIKKLILTVGLPASGKTTWAEKFVVDNYDTAATIVCKDSLRLLHPDYKESQIIQERNIITDKLMKNEWNYIIWADTNFNPIHKAKAEEFCKTYSYELEIKYFDTPLEECIKRDIKRGDKAVGEQVIKKMYYQWVYKPKEVKYDPKLEDCYIFDIDGTLAIMGNRKPYDWNKVSIDEVNKIVAKMLDLISSNGTKVFIFSGRDSICREDTLNWLDKNICYKKGKGNLDEILFMRKEGDNTKDTTIKEDMYNEQIKGKYNVLGIFDDRPCVCRMWRSLGLPVFQVGNPDLEF